MAERGFCLRCGSDISVCVCPEDPRAYPVIQRLESENTQLKQCIVELKKENTGLTEQKAAFFTDFEKFRQRIAALESQLQSKEAELQRFRTMSMVEIMCENERVRAYVTEWENRCLKAESELQEARQQLAREQRTVEEMRAEIDIDVVQKNTLRGLLAAAEERLKVAVEALEFVSTVNSETIQTGKFSRYEWPQIYKSTMYQMRWRSDEALEQIKVK